MNVCRWHDGDGNRMVIVAIEGRKKLTVVLNDGKKVTTKAIPKAETPFEYPIQKAKKTLRRQGKAFGITKAARKLLRA